MSRRYGPGKKSSLLDRALDKILPDSMLVRGAMVAVSALGFAACGDGPVGPCTTDCPVEDVAPVINNTPSSVYNPESGFLVVKGSASDAQTMTFSAETPYKTFTATGTNPQINDSVFVALGDAPVNGVVNWTAKNAMTATPKTTPFTIPAKEVETPTYTHTFTVTELHDHNITGLEGTLDVSGVTANFADGVYTFVSAPGEVCVGFRNATHNQGKQAIHTGYMNEGRTANWSGDCAPLELGDEDSSHEVFTWSDNSSVTPEFYLDVVVQGNLNEAHPGYVAPIVNGVQKVPYLFNDDKAKSVLEITKEWTRTLLNNYFPNILSQNTRFKVQGEEVNQFGTNEVGIEIWARGDPPGSHGEDWDSNGRMTHMDYESPERGDAGIYRFRDVFNEIGQAWMAPNDPDGGNGTSAYLTNEDGTPSQKAIEFNAIHQGIGSKAAGWFGENYSTSGN